MNVHPPLTTLPDNGRAARPQATERKGRLRTAVIASALALLALAIGLYVRSRMSPPLGYITSAVARKDLVDMVTATGTVNPQNTIYVGTQVSGTIQELDADFNSVVKDNQVLARLDPTSFKAAFDSSQAAEAQAQSVWNADEASAASARQNALTAQANVAAAGQAFALAQSQVAKAQAALRLANLTVDRDRELLLQGFIAQSQADTDASNAVAAKSAYDAAVIAVRQADAQLQAQIAAERASIAQVRSAEATVVAARHSVDQQRAAVSEAQYNLSNTVIRSPANGTVVARNVSVGQTVAASFQTPTLFTLGQDLTKMEVDVAVGEPDIGGIRAGDAVDFTVLAYPNRTFHGIVYQVRKNPTTVSNVVTYDTVVYVDNKDGALYPGMTANASIHVAKVTNALVLPITALQWSPPEQARPKRSASTSTTPASPWGMTESSLTRTIVAGRNGRAFVYRSGKLTYVPVRVLLVTDTEAAVAPTKAGSLHAGDPVVTSDTTSQAAAQQGVATSALTTRQPSYGGGRVPGGR